MAQCQMTSLKFTLLQVMQYSHMFQYHVTHIHRSRPGMYIQFSNHKFFLPLSAESRLRRSVDASNTHTSDIKTGDGTTWWRPFSPADIGKSRFRRIVGAGNTPARTGEAGDAYTLNNQMADGTTWRHLFSLSKLAKSQLFLPAHESRQHADKIRLRR